MTILRVVCVFSVRICSRGWLHVSPPCLFSTVPAVSQGFRAPLVLCALLVSLLCASLCLSLAPLGVARERLDVQLRDASRLWRRDDCSDIPFGHTQLFSIG